MSIVLFVAFPLAGAAGAAVSLAVFRALARFGRARSGAIFGAIAGFIVATASFVPAISCLSKATTTTLIAMDPREGERRLSFVGVPANTTSDFSYRYALVGTTVLADFQMSENDFLNWMNIQQWNPVAFDHGPNEFAIPVENANFPNFHTDDLVYPVREYESRTQRQVKRGYCYYWSMPGNFDNTIKIIYDRDTNRAYVEHTTY